MTIVPFAVSGCKNTAGRASGHEENVLPPAAARRFHDAVFAAMQVLTPAGHDTQADAACRHLLAAAYIVNGLSAPPAQRARPARDVAPGESWAFHTHRSLQEGDDSGDR